MSWWESKKSQYDIRHELAQETVKKCDQTMINNINYKISRINRALNNSISDPSRWNNGKIEINKKVKWRNSCENVLKSSESFHQKLEDYIKSQTFVDSANVDFNNEQIEIKVTLDPNYSKK